MLTWLMGHAIFIDRHKGYRPDALTYLAYAK